MKRSSAAAREVIEVSSDESTTVQPPRKSVKKEGNRDTTSAQEQKKLVDELKKKLAEASAKLDEATRKEKNMAKNEFDMNQEIVALKFEIVGLKKASYLTNQMGIELQEANDDRAKDRARINELTIKLAEYEGRMEQQQQLEEELRRVNEERMKDRERLTETSMQLEEAKRETRNAQNREEMNALSSRASQLEQWQSNEDKRMSDRERINELRRHHKEETRRVNKDLVRDRWRIVELTSKLTKLRDVERQCDQLKKELRKASIEQARDRARIEELACKRADAEREKQLLQQQIKVPIPVSTEEVVKSQEKVAKLERDLKRAIRIAGEHLARVEFLERLIDQKPAVIDGGEKKKVEELQKKLDETSKQLDEARTESAKNISTLKQQVEVERSQASADRETDQLRMNKLTRQLAQFEAGQHPQLAPSKVKEVQAKKAVTFEAHPADLKNIFKRLPWDAPDTILFSNAHKELSARCRMSDSAWREKCKKAVMYETLSCEMCNDELHKFGILVHLTSKKHFKQSRNSAISLAAFNYWMRKLESIVAVKATPRNPFALHPTVSVLSTELADIGVTTRPTVPVHPRVTYYPTIPGDITVTSRPTIPVHPRVAFDPTASADITVTTGLAVRADTTVTTRPTIPYRFTWGIFDPIVPARPIVSSDAIVPAAAKINYRGQERR